MVLSMASETSISRRSFLAMAAAAPLVSAAPQGTTIPLGLELYSVRDELAKDLNGTVTAVAKMGYEVVEFFSPYFTWSLDQAKDVRKLLDDLGIRCSSTHNGGNAFTGGGIAKAIDLNSTIGSKFIVMASPPRLEPGLDGYRKLGDTITQAVEKFRAAGLRGGYHNHQTEFKPVDGKRPIEVIAANTPKDFMLQFDVGTCVEVGQDPVAWINANPGRINSLHCKDWAAGEGKGYQVLFGDGDVPWKEVFRAADSKGGLEFLLIEQEGSRMSPFETVERCLRTYYGSEIHARILDVPREDWLEIEELSSLDLDGTRIIVVLDFSYRRGNQVVILDWKTGASDERDNLVQLACYTLYAGRRWGAPPGDVRAIEFNVNRNQVIEHTLTAEDIDRTAAFIKGSIADMKRLLRDPERNEAREDDFPRIDDPRVCSRCNFFRVCGPNVPWGPAGPGAAVVSSPADRTPTL